MRRGHVQSHVQLGLSRAGTDEGAGARGEMSAGAEQASGPASQPRWRWTPETATGSSSPAIQARTGRLGRGRVSLGYWRDRRSRARSTSRRQRALLADPDSQLRELRPRSARNRFPVLARRWPSGSQVYRGSRRFHRRRRSLASRAVSRLITYRDATHLGLAAAGAIGRPGNMDRGPGSGLVRRG